MYTIEKGQYWTALISGILSNCPKERKKKKRKGQGNRGWAQGKDGERRRGALILIFADFHSVNAPTMASYHQIPEGFPADSLAGTYELQYTPSSEQILSLSHVILKSCGPGGVCAWPMILIASPLYTEAVKYQV